MMSDIDFGSKLTTILSFLFIFWVLSNFLINKFKSGEWRVPKFLENYLSIKNNFIADKPHDIKIVQREILHDGSELLVVSIDERKLLLSKTMQNGLNFVIDIEDK